MTTEIDKLKNELLALPKETRANLAKTLIDSLDETTDENINNLWLEEINKRNEEIQNKSVRTRPANEVLKDALKNIK